MTENASTDEVRFEIAGSVGLITLDRPKALNSLSQPMCLAIDRSLGAWARDDRIAAVAVRGSGDRAFCAGGDVRAIYDDGLALKRGSGGGRIVREFFRDEYRMNRRIKTFPKPYIALIDGITMGGGIGLSVHGSHRVATERTLAAMPETGIGLFPDVGASYVLPRMPGRMGTYLALTGARIKAPDLIALGAATHHVSSARIAELLGDLTAADWSVGPSATADAILARHATDPGAAELPRHRAAIDRGFAAERVEEILDALDAEGSDFASGAAATIRTMSPTSLKLTLKEMRRGKSLDFDACMVMEYRLTQSVLAGHDFYEGIRAQLVDKDRNPKWDPPTLAGVDEAAIDAYFLPPPHGDLTFPD
jgi:enoyl-CoA hydratase